MSLENWKAQIHPLKGKTQFFYGVHGSKYKKNLRNSYSEENFQSKAKLTGNS